MKNSSRPNVCFKALLFVTRNKFKFFIGLLCRLAFFLSHTRTGGFIFIEKKTDDEGKTVSSSVDFSVKSFYKLRLEFHDIDDFLFERTQHFLPEVEECKFSPKKLCNGIFMYINNGMWERNGILFNSRRPTRCAMLDMLGGDRINATFSLCLAKTSS